MSACRICGSFAINEHLYDRTPGIHSDLCDVHYWQTIAQETAMENERLRGIMRMYKTAQEAHELNTFSGTVSQKVYQEFLDSHLDMCKEAMRAGRENEY